MADEPTAAPVAPATPVKPGWKTTEFWLHLATAIIGGILALPLPQSNKVMQIAGMAAMILSACGYSVTRASVKNAAQVLMIGLLLFGSGCKTIDAKTLAEFQGDDAKFMKDLGSYLDADQTAGKKTPDQVTAEKTTIAAHNAKVLADVTSVDPAEEQALIAEILGYVQGDPAKSAGFKSAYGGAVQGHLDLFNSVHR